MKKLSLIVICLMAIAGCGQKEKPASDNVAIGKYLFIGDNGIIHKNESCHALKFSRDEDGHRAYGKTYADTSEFVYDPTFSFCTRCIDSADYEHIITLSQTNSKKQNIKKPNPMN